MEIDGVADGTQKQTEQTLIQQQAQQTPTPPSNVIELIEEDVDTSTTEDNVEIL